MCKQIGTIVTQDSNLHLT